MKTTATSLFLALLLCGCTTLGPVREPVLPGQGGGSVLHRLFTATFTRATMKDEVFEGASVESIDSGDAVKGVVADALRPRLGILSDVAGALIQERFIESAGTRAWSVNVVGDPADAPARWFFVRPGARASDVAVLPANQPVTVYARRVEIPGVVSALIVTRWTRK